MYIAKQNNGRPFVKKAHQIQLLLANWPISLTSSIPLGNHHHGNKKGIYLYIHVQVWGGVCCAISHLRPYRVRVVGLDNFKYEPVDNEVVYVEMGIYHGGHLLGSTCHTVEMAPTTYMRWNQWLVFDVQLKNLPKVWLWV